MSACDCVSDDIKVASPVSFRKYACGSVVDLSCAREFVNIVNFWREYTPYVRTRDFHTRIYMIFVT